MKRNCLAKVEILLEDLNETIKNSKEESHRLRNLKRENSAIYNDGVTAGIIEVKRLLEIALDERKGVS